MTPEQAKAFKAFKKRLRAFNQDASSSSGPASHLSSGSPEFTAIEPPNSYPQEVWDALVANGRLRKVEGRILEINK